MAKSSLSSGHLIKSITSVILMCAMIMSFPHLSRGGISCTTVYGDLYPCMSFVMTGAILDPACCAGAKALFGKAATTPDRQTVCACLKSLLSKVNDDQLKNAAKIPGLCGVQIPIPITRDADCIKVTLI